MALIARASSHSGILPTMAFVLSAQFSSAIWRRQFAPPQRGPEHMELSGRRSCAVGQTNQKSVAVNNMGIFRLWHTSTAEADNLPKWKKCTMSGLILAKNFRK